MKERWTYIPIEKYIRDIIKEKKGILTYTEYFTKIFTLDYDESRGTHLGECRACHKNSFCLSDDGYCGDCN